MLATIQNIISTLKIPKSTIYDWKNRAAEDWRNNILQILISMTIDEIKNKRIKRMTKENLKKLSKDEILDFIRKELSFSEISKHLRGDCLELLKKEHKRFEMSGYEGKTGECTVSNINILNEFAYLGIYDYTTYLFLDFYKGTPTLYYQYWGSTSNEEEDFGGYTTTELIYEIFKKTILTDKATRRRG